VTETSGEGRVNAFLALQAQGADRFTQLVKTIGIQKEASTRESGSTDYKALKIHQKLVDDYQALKDSDPYLAMKAAQLARLFKNGAVSESEIEALEKKARKKESTELKDDFDAALDDMLNLKKSSTKDVMTLKREHPNFFNTLLEKGLKREGKSATQLVQGVMLPTARDYRDDGKFEKAMAVLSFAEELDRDMAGGTSRDQISAEYSKTAAAARKVAAKAASKSRV
jgi:hypothetical protein